MEYSPTQKYHPTLPLTSTKGCPMTWKDQTPMLITLRSPRPGRSHHYPRWKRPDQCYRWPGDVSLGISVQPCTWHWKWEDLSRSRYQQWCAELYENGYDAYHGNPLISLLLYGPACGYSNSKIPHSNSWTSLDSMSAKVPDLSRYWIFRECNPNLTRVRAM